MDRYAQALSWWQQQPAAQRHAMVLALLLAACLAVGWGWIRPLWQAVQQAPQQVEQLERQWQTLSDMAQRLQRHAAQTPAPHQAPNAASAAAQASEAEVLHQVGQLLGACGSARLLKAALRVEMQQCSAAQVVQLGQWVATHTGWQTESVDLALDASTAAWQGTWVWQR